MQSAYVFAGLSVALMLCAVIYLVSMMNKTISRLLKMAADQRAELWSRIDSLQALLLSRNEREAFLLAENSNRTPYESPASVDIQSLFDESDEYRPQADGSNVLVDLTTDHNALGLEN
jgi:hypothetical protein